jgi:phosphoribosyl 1,2-cyclic phosphate phosphodiesterase
MQSKKELKMIIIYIGTAASEGLPALFCQCPVCCSARKNGGHEFRGRAGICVNGRLLIDIPPDINYGAAHAGVSLPDIADLIVTHSHEDHFDAYELSTRRTPVYCVRRPDENSNLRVFGNRRTGEKLSLYVPGAETGSAVTDGVIFTYAPMFEPIETAAGITATPLPASHDRNEECRMYLLEESNNTCSKRFLYGHDTGLFPNETIEFLRGKRCDLISLDCTNVMQNGEHYHMGLPADIKMKQKLNEIGAADANTRFILNHFSHNGFIDGGKHYSLAEFEETAAKAGFSVSYDGMKVVI